MNRRKSPRHAENNHNHAGEGKIEGKLEGRTERDMEIARNMKNDGFDAGIISRITGLSLTEIE